MSSWREPVRALLLGLTASVLYLLLVQDRMPGDASGLVAGLTRAAEDQGPDTFWYHLLYAWCARGLELALPFLEVRTVLELLSALSAGLALPLAWLALRRLGLSNRGAVGAALLLAVAPAMVQHATIIEVHGFQLASGLAALALVARARDLGPAALVGLGLVAGVLVNLGHQTGPLLFPGLVLASFWGAGTRALPSDLPGRALRFAAAAAGYLGAIGLARLGTERFSPFEDIRAFSDMTELTAMLVKPVGWGFLRDELLAGLPVLLLVGLLGAVGALRGGSAAEARPEPDNRTARAALTDRTDRAGAARRLAWLGLVLVAVPYGFFLFFGERTEGGYFLGAAPGLVLLTGLFLDRRGGHAATAALVLVSLPLAWQLYHRADHAEANERAAARVVAVEQLLPDGGTVYAMQYNEHSLAGSRPGLREVNDSGSFRKLVEDTLAAPADVDTDHLPDLYAQQIGRKLARLHAEQPPLVVDWTWTPATLHHDRRTWRPFLDAVRAELDRSWDVTEHHDRWGVLLELEPR